MDLIKIDFQNIDTFTTDFLIINEENIDWEILSQFKGRSFSMAEIRMFRKKIQWNLYLINHALSNIELNIASKYFSDSVFAVLSAFVSLPEEFIKKHHTKLSWKYLIQRSYISEDLLFELQDDWIHLDDQILINGFSKNPFIDLNSNDYNRLALYLKLKN